MTDHYVLDSFALTAYIQHEAGAPRVTQLFQEAQAGLCRLTMSVVNLGETLYVTYRRGGPDAFAAVLNLVADLPLELVNADAAMTVTASRIKAVLPISFGDCYASALALDRKGTVVTGDRDFERVEHLIPVDWLPQR